MTKLLPALLILGVALFLPTCGGKNGMVGGGQGNSVFLKSVSLTPVNPTISLAVAPQSPSTAQFVVIGTYNVGNPKDITDQMTWISLDTKVATVDSKGVATAAGSGRVIINAQIFEPATQKTLQASTVLTVVPQITSMTVNPGSAQIAKNTSQQFTATGKYNDGTQADITALVSWSSSNPAAATVSSSPGTQGRVSGLIPGSTNISAVLGSLSSSAGLTVSNADLVSLVITPANPTVPLASSKPLHAIGTFDDGSSQDITATASWKSLNSTIARVTSSGSVTGLGIGTAQITATAGALSDTTSATVDASSVLKISLVPASKIASRTRLQMRAAASLQDGAIFDVTQTPGIVWTTSNPGIATVVANSGQVSALAPGSATISAQLGSQTGSTTLNVADATIQALSVAPNQTAIAPGTTQNMIALATFADGTSTFQQDVSSSAAWSSDNTGIATVSFANGLQELASGQAPGTANIAAAFSDGHGNVANSSSVLNVSSAVLNAVSVTPGNTGITLGGGHQFIATGTFSDGTVQDVTLTASWSAADSATAEINSFGFALAGGPGQTSVAATLLGETGSSAVVVNPGALAKIDICTATVVDPLDNCPPLDPLTPPPPISFAKLVPFGLVAIGTFTDGSREDLTSSARWTSSNPSIATISNDPGIPGFVSGIASQGFVTGIVGGHVTVTAIAGGIRGSSDVIVTDATPAFLTVTPIDSSIHLGLTQQLAVVATFSNSTTADVTRYVTWSTSNSAAVIVYPGGLAYSSGPGTARVSAGLGEVSGSTTLTVQ